MVGASSFREVDTAPDAEPFPTFPRDLQALGAHVAGAADADRLGALVWVAVAREPQLGVDVPACGPLDPRVIHGHGRP